MDSGPAIVNLPYFVLVFISGTYFPISGTLAKISDYFPLRPMILSMYKVFDPTNTGSIWDPHQLWILALWGVGSTLFAVRHFRWTPRRT
jgi:ABC-type polysaccharide/polyol phosphate export permease